MLVRIAGAGVALFVCSAASAQGTFQNLDFEAANPVFVSPPSGTIVTAASALPDWTVTIGGVQQTQLSENDPSLGSPWVSLVGPGDKYGAPIDGNYSVLLQGGGSAAAASISQNGVIPAGTRSLLFEAQPPVAPAPNGPLNLFVGTQTVPFIAVGTGPNYTLYAANISTWAGQHEELAFSDPGNSGNWELDDITFSQIVVTPEPSPLALTGIAGLLFVCTGVLRSNRSEKQKVVNRNLNP